MTNDIVISATREHKDRLFNFIFGREENKKWTLALYNAVNGSNHEDESQIEFNTLENYLYVSMKNDTSFLFADYVSLYEHMSEVAIMLSEELQELNAKELIARASEKKGMQKGIQKGMQKGLQKGMQEGLQKGLQKGITDTNTLYSWLFAQDRANDVKKAASDINYMEKLMAEYNNITKEE